MTDLRRIDDLIRSVGDLSMPAGLQRYCQLDHVALLVFPDSFDGLVASLRERGLAPDDGVPSVVVRERLRERYGRSFDVRIYRAPISGGVHLEIFALPLTSDLAEIAAAERSSGTETHLAFRVTAPDRIVLSGLRTALLDSGYASDGGGYNEHVNATVLYFRNDAEDNPVNRRLELICDGHFREVVATHAGQQDQAAKRLLRLMTGAWTTQAIAVAADLGLADRLSAGPASAADLATATGSHADSLLRLLRYLASLGIVRESAGAYQLTEVGRLLRKDADRSLHPLAVLYGGSFYESFGALGHAVRTGAESFEFLFGKNHFDYFADHPELGELFNRAMASSASMFGQVADLVDASGPRTVVDIAGGDGELLSQILRTRPHLRGVLFERSHVLDAARTRLEKAGCLDRVELVAGDFTAGVPGGGDVYLLSRILHDWDDAQCQKILDQCAAVMAAGSELLVVERLLPEDGSASLAVAWDLHMLCNVGGRERTVTEFRRLLAASGFELQTVHPLPLDAGILRATRRP